jgi:hypothetical protein
VTAAVIDARDGVAPRDAPEDVSDVHLILSSSPLLGPLSIAIFCSRSI